MEKQVYIYQQGSVPDKRIIEELERRGGMNAYGIEGRTPGYYYIAKDGLVSRDLTNDDLFWDYTQLMYDESNDCFEEEKESEFKRGVKFARRLGYMQGVYDVVSRLEGILTQERNDSEKVILALIELLKIRGEVINEK